MPAASASLLVMLDVVLALLQSSGALESLVLKVAAIQSNRSQLIYANTLLCSGAPCFLLQSSGALGYLQRLRLSVAPGQQHSRMQLWAL
jgi:hypothetical protein